MENNTLKTRIISGLVALAVLIAVLVANFFSGYVAVTVLSILAAIAVFEMLSNTGCIKNKAAIIVAMVYAALVQFVYNTAVVSPVVLTFLYIFSIVLFAVFDHKNFGERQITMSLSMPIILPFAFSCLGSIINHTDGYGLFYLFLVLNFACITDISAYFVGINLGKHKLAPEISPKKTVEGAVGGIIGAMLGTVIMCIVFGWITGLDAKLWILLAVTPFMSVVGMMGDLFASAIKRAYGIKDYGNIMPGHGGVLDRLDSVLLIAPAFALFLSLVTVL